MRRPSIAIALVAVALVAILLLRTRAKTPENTRAPSELVQGQTASAAAPTSPEAIQSTDPGQPRFQAKPAIRVVDENGHPIEGARVDRIPRPADWRSRLNEWPADSDADFRLAIQSGVSDSTGLAEIPTVSPSFATNGSLLWVRSNGRRTTWLPLPSDPAPNTEAMEIQLPASRDLEVLVLDMDGQPVVSAVVIERADFGDWPLLSEKERDARQFEFLPRASATTDAQGRAHLPVLPVRAWVQAVAGDRTSSGWSGIGSNRVTLRLAATCEVEGRVIDEGGAAIPVESAVSCQVRRGTDFSFLALAPIRAGGTFGPVRLPLLSEDGFLFQYLGGDFEATQTLLAAPQPGSRSVIEIRTRAGLGVDLHVVDEQSHPIANVVINLQWTRNDQWSRVDRRTDADGRAHLTHLPTGQVWVRMRKPGYVPALKELFRAEQWVRNPLEVTLNRAGSIDGVCTSQGQPARNFTVYFWQKSPRDGGKIVVEGSDDGTFKIEEAAPGLVQLFATSDDLIQSAQRSLEVDPGAVGKVQLDLPVPRVAKGQVLDAETGDPLPGASVKAMLVVSQSSIKPWKAAQPVDEHGRFEYRGFGPAEGRLSIAAEGYAMRELTVWAGNSGSMDLGPIALHRSQRLLVRLRSTSTVDFASYGVTLSSETRVLPGVRFSSEGIVQFSDLSPGMVRLQLEANSGATMGRSVRIRPGGNNACEFELDGLPLDILVIPPNGQSLPENASIALYYVDSSGEQVGCGYALPSSGQVHLDHLAADRVLLEVLSGDEVTLASMSTVLPREGPRKITFEMTPTPQHLRTIDSTHRPIAGARLYLSGRSGTLSVTQEFVTDANGEASVPDAGPDPLWISAVHSDYGVLPCTQLSLSDSHGRATDVLIPQGNDVDIELRDGTDVLRGVEIELTDACGGAMAIGRVLAGLDGRVHFKHISPGDYRVVVDHPGIWRAEQPITVGGSPGSFTVQLRRLGSARVHARSGLGNAIDGASVELVDIATNSRVADWIQRGDVPSPAGGMHTDASGALVIQGLPRGGYRCVVTAPSGASVERTLEVPAQAMGELDAVLQ